METATVTATAAKETTPVVKESKVIQSKYTLNVNLRPGGYHSSPKKLREDTARIGSEFKKDGGGAIIRGLSTDQERYFSKDLINKNPKDQGFDEAMTAYWAEYGWVVPKQGEILDASYQLKTVKIDNEQVEIEFPNNLIQYIKATFAKQSSKVAFTADQLATSDLYDIIMKDLSVAQRDKENNFKAKLEADRMYVDLLGNVTEKDHAKVDWLLDMLKEENELFYSSTYSDKCMRLSELKDAKGEEFIKACSNPNLEVKSLLFRLKQSLIVTVEGKAIFFGDQLLGSTDEETIVFLKDQTKSGVVAKMKAQLGEVLKRKI